MAYQQVTLTYTGPSGRVWQLQGPDQHDQPVTLQPGPMGFYGTDITVNTQSAVRSRKRHRSSVVADPINLELRVRLDAPSPAAMAALIEDWLNDWPEDEELAGTLTATGIDGASRHLDVYRTEAPEPLMTRDPLVGQRAAFLIVASSDDPYPYGSYTPGVQALTANIGRTVSVYNRGHVTAYPDLVYTGGAGVLTITTGSNTPLTIHPQGDTLISLDPENLTITDARGTQPIVARWDDSWAVPVEPGKGATISLLSTVAGTVETHLRPQFTRLYP